MYTLSRDMNMYSVRIKEKIHSHTHGRHILYSAQTHLHTASIACDRCWQEYCQQESSFISFYSLCILACLSLYTQCGHVTEAVSFSLPVPLCTFLFSSFSPLSLSPPCYHHEFEVTLCQERLEEKRTKRGGH